MNRKVISTGDIRHSDSGKAASVFLIIVLLVVTVIVYLTTRVPQEAIEELSDITEENARSCELKLRLLVRNGERGKSFSAYFSSAELNSIILKGYVIDGFEQIKKYTRQGDISVEELRIDLASGEILLTFKTYVKFKYLYVRLAGRLKTEGATVVMVVSKVSIGQLPFSLRAAPLVAGIIGPGEEPLSVKLPDYVKSVGIEGDKLLVTVGK